jgi:hypothetical protein
MIYLFITFLLKLSNYIVPHAAPAQSLTAAAAAHNSTFRLQQSLLQQLTDHCSNQCPLDWKKGLEVTEPTDKQSGERFPLY